MGCVYPRKNKLWIRYKAADGKWTQQKTSLHVGDEKKARRILLDVEARIAAGVKFDPLNASASVTVAAYARRWLEERRHLVADAGNDEARLKYHILPAIGGLLLEEVRPRHLVEMVSCASELGQARTEVDLQRLQHDQGAVPRREDRGPPHRRSADDPDEGPARRCGRQRSRVAGNGALLPRGARDPDLRSTPSRTRSAWGCCSHPPTGQIPWPSLGILPSTGESVEHRGRSEMQNDRTIVGWRPGMRRPCETFPGGHNGSRFRPRATADHFTKS